MISYANHMHHHEGNIINLIDIPVYNHNARKNYFQTKQLFDLSRKEIGGIPNYRIGEISCLRNTPRSRLHEEMHVIDYQAKNGIFSCLTDEYIPIAKGRRDTGEEIDRVFSQDRSLHPVRKIRNLIHDVLEARAMIVQIRGSLLIDELDAPYYHPIYYERSRDFLIAMTEGTPAKFQKTFIENDPSQSLEEFAHEPHDGGVLLLAFLDTMDIDQIVEKLNYEGLNIPGARGDSTQTAVRQRLLDLMQDPGRTKSMIVDGWGKLSLLLDGLTDRYKEEMAKLL